VWLNNKFFATKSFAIKITKYFDKSLERPQQKEHFEKHVNIVEKIETQNCSIHSLNLATYGV
jgi:hypothetical protein